MEKEEEHIINMAVKVLDNVIEDGMGKMKIWNRKQALSHSLL